MVEGKGMIKALVGLDWSAIIQALARSVCWRAGKSKALADIILCQNRDVGTSEDLFALETQHKHPLEGR